MAAWGWYMKYLDIYVMISPARGDDFQVSAKSDAGGEGNSHLKLPFTLSDLSGIMFGAAGTPRGIGAGEEPTARLQTAETLGVQLFEALFNGETREVLSRTEDVAKRQSEKTGVRIRLSMNLAAQGMAEVASLPWELMRRNNQKPLVVSVNTPVVRAFDTAMPIYLHPITGKLKILLLVSNPTGTTALNLGSEKERICRIWDSLENVEYVECRPVADKILDTLSQDEFHVVHYMGHGDFDAGLGGQVIMERGDGTAQPISGDVFATWLQDEPLRLVFLNACNTGTTGQNNGLHPFAGVASSLISSGVPSVLAMQFPITDEAAIIFAQTFYKRIAQGLPVEQAVSEGRKGLLDRQGSEWATPVLYMRAAHGDLFDRSTDGPKERKRDPEQVAAAPFVPVAQPDLAPAQFAEPLAVSRPWYKKPAILGGIGAALLALLVWAVWPGTDKPAATVLASEATETDQTSVTDPNNPASQAIADIDEALWVNDPNCDIVNTVLSATTPDNIKVTTDNIKALADAGSAKASYLEGCIAYKGLKGPNGSDPSKAAAATWFAYAAKADIVQAMYFMGVLELNGVPADDVAAEVAADPQSAVQSFKKAKAGGNLQAAEQLPIAEAGAAAAASGQ